jgi:shikimate 5-dehydrogenase
VTRYFSFVGVTTGSSSIMKIFPRWRDYLGLGDDVVMEGRDLPIHAPREQYRATVEAIKSDPAHLGGLVTTHKIDLYRATTDLFDEVDRFAMLCHEVSCIAHRAGRLLGWAKDPISAGQSLDDILGPGYFGRKGGDVLCFGAGGSAVAITLHLLTRPDPADRPRRIVVTNRTPERLENLRTLHQQLSHDVTVEYVRNQDPRVHDELMSGLPRASLVINATGMGKDTPGSPITDAGVFPEEAVAWELNYRGDLDFLYQAWAQRETRHVRVEDGWKYFIYGWTAVMEEVFDRKISADELEALSQLAAFARPPLPTNDSVATA